MKKLKRILAPVDLSENSQSGLKVAFALAAENGAELLALHVANEFQAWQMLDETGFASDRIYRWEIDRVVRESLLDLNRFLELSLCDMRLLSNVRRRVVLGDPATKILDVAHEEESDLVVISPRRRSVFRFFFSSVTDKVTRLAPCPVLSVSPERRQQSPRGKEAPIISGWLQGLEAS
jgi:nucleotide-binding universal stress UspA family protein